MRHSFMPGHRLIARSTTTSVSVSDMDATTMFWRGTPEHLKKHGGDLTRGLLDELESLPAYLRACDNAGDCRVVVDSRVTMIQAPGWYPSIPGWHGDAVPRQDGGQPDLQSTDPRIQHFLILLATQPDGVSATEFLCDSVEIDVDEANVRGSVDAALRARQNRTQRCKAGRWYMFNQGALHRATPATTAGWRLFFRVSVFPADLFPHGPLNTVRRHSQVYMDINNAGW